MVSPTGQNSNSELGPEEIEINDVEWCRCLYAQPVIKCIDFDQYPGRCFVGCVNGEIVSFSCLSVNSLVYYEKLYRQCFIRRTC